MGWFWWRCVFFWLVLMGFVFLLVFCGSFGYFWERNKGYFLVLNNTTGYYRLKFVLLSSIYTLICPIATMVNKPCSITCSNLYYPVVTCSMLACSLRFLRYAKKTHLCNFFMAVQIVWFCTTFVNANCLVLHTFCEYFCVFLV